MRVDVATPDDAAARVRRLHALEPCQQRRDQHDRRTHAADQVRRQLGLAHVTAADAQCLAAQAFDLGTEPPQEVAHHDDVGNLRHVVQHALVVGEQRGRHDGQDGVLAGGGLNGSVQRYPTVDDIACQPVSAFLVAPHSPVPL